MLTIRKSKVERFLASLCIIGMLLTAVPVHADNFWWVQLASEDFERGAARWALEAGWEIEIEANGNHALTGTGPASARMLASAPFQDHRLSLRVRLVSGEFRVHLRAADATGYTVCLSQERIALLRRERSGRVAELASAALPEMEEGWYTLLATLYGDHMMISWGGIEYINIVDQGEIGRGALVLEALGGCRVQVDNLWITGQLPLPQSPPDTTRITIGEADASGMAGISGLPGAVPPHSVVFLANLQTLDWTATEATADGSFEAILFAPESSTIQVNYAYPGSLPLFESIGLEGSPAVLLTAYRPQIGSASSFTIFDCTDDGHWLARGELPQRAYQPGEILTTTLQLRIESAAVPRLDLGNFRIHLRLALLRLFDGQGRQLPPVRSMASAFMTPSGLPVEAQRETADPWLWEADASEIVRQGRLLTATLSVALPIPADLPFGIYCPRPRLEFLEQRGGQWLPVKALTANDELFMQERQDARRAESYPWPLLPPIRIGQPAAPRIAWSILSDYTSNSERGVRAAQDTHYALSPRTVFPTGRFVIPMNNESTGQPVAYSLEPSLPLTSWSLRPLYEQVLLSPPSIPFAYPNGRLRVQVTKPDGSPEDLGESVLLSGLNPLMNYRPDQADPRRTHRAQRVAFDTPGPADYYRATTGSDRFAYRFTQYGRHIITLSGEMQDIWGNVYQAGGTYEVWVAHALDIETGVMLGTPFQVGDVYSPVVRIQPAVPAKVTLDWALYVNSSQENVQRRHIEGRANRFGYFHPGASQSPLYITAPGEYDVLITASYWDEKGELWMGAVRGANVVETPGTSLVAHGERGIRSFAAVKRPVWFAEGRYGNVIPMQTDGLYQERVLGGALHIPYPYFLGDVMWPVDREGVTSIFPTITFQDTNGHIADLLEARVPELAEGDLYYGQFPPSSLPLNQRAIGELPLVTTTSAGKSDRAYGWPVGQFPQMADQIGYFYSSCQRPDVSVSCIVAEAGLDNAYWFVDDAYNLQYGVGVNGDISPDFKLNFGGLVFRDLAHGINEYAIYNSADVYIPLGEEQSNRVMPPFQGAAGGPSGGPLMTLKGKAIDLFVHPTGVKPGSILEVGDTFSFAAQIVPTLDSWVTVTVTTPLGLVRQIKGQANKIGYFYDPAQDFIVTEPGVYQVRVRGEHRGITSAGPVYPPYPQGDVLGSDEGIFYVYVVGRSSEPLALDVAESAFVYPAQPLTLHSGSEILEAYYALSLSGFILEQGMLPMTNGVFTYTYDPITLNQDFPNLDTRVIPPYLTYIPWEEPEAVDTVQLSFFAIGRDGSARARAVTLQGTQLLAPFIYRASYRQALPLLLKR